MVLSDRSVKALKRQECLFYYEPDADLEVAMNVKNKLQSTWQCFILVNVLCTRLLILISPVGNDASGC